jgi:hypothetical protein
MKPLAITDTPTIVLGLQDEIRRSRESRYDHRLHGVLLVTLGMSCPELSSLLGDSPRTVEYSGFVASKIMVDEVGYIPIDRECCNLFFRFIANRDEKASTVITSNKAFSVWTELFHDPVIVSAILERLLHRSTVINIRGTASD